MTQLDGRLDFIETDRGAGYNKAGDRALGKAVVEGVEIGDGETLSTTHKCTQALSIAHSRAKARDRLLGSLYCSSGIRPSKPVLMYITAADSAPHPYTMVWTLIKMTCGALLTIAPIDLSDETIRFHLDRSESVTAPRYHAVFTVGAETMIASVKGLYHPALQEDHEQEGHDL
ncbi:hypothetical protein ACLMJK_009279 [Lecanora helva]